MSQRALLELEALCSGEQSNAGPGPKASLVNVFQIAPNAYGPRLERRKVKRLKNIWKKDMKTTYNYCAQLSQKYSLEHHFTNVRCHKRGNLWGHGALRVAARSVIKSRHQTINECLEVFLGQTPRIWEERLDMSFVTMFATRNKCIATRSKGLTSSNKKLVETITKFEISY